MASTVRQNSNGPGTLGQQRKIGCMSTGVFDQIERDVKRLDGYQTDEKNKSKTEETSDQ